MKLHRAAMKCTQYFLAMRARPDRVMIRDEWIERAIESPAKEKIQADGRIRRWAQIAEMDGKFLRVILLADGERFTTHFLTGHLNYESEIL